MTPRVIASFEAITPFMTLKRVLKPGGRVLVVDFAESTRQSKGPLAHFHRHGGVPRHEVAGVAAYFIIAQLC